MCHFFYVFIFLQFEGKMLMLSVWVLLTPSSNVLNWMFKILFSISIFPYSVHLCNIFHSLWFYSVHNIDSTFLSFHEKLNSHKTPLKETEHIWILIKFYYQKKAVKKKSNLVGLSINIFYFFSLMHSTKYLGWCTEFIKKVSKLNETCILYYINNIQ